MANPFDTKTGSLVAADFPYYRLPRERWELMLTRVRQMGVNTLVVAMPWGFHEPSRGRIDVNGRSSARRDVAALLALCRHLDLACILNPGPYHPDVLADGLPLWLTAAETALPAAAEGWIKTLTENLAAYQWPEGPVFALQVKSEPAAAPAAPAGKELTEVNWRIWLRKRYEGIEALNAAYGAAYRTVNEVKFPEAWARGETPVDQDAREFLATVRHERQQSYVHMLAEAGWQVPIAVAEGEILPPFRSCSLAGPEAPACLAGHLAGEARIFLHLQQPFQVEPDAVELGAGPAWAIGAPIRPDGSARYSFWAIRQLLWPHTLAAGQAANSAGNELLHVTFEGGGLVTAGSSTGLKLSTAGSAKPVVYRLGLNGELAEETQLKTGRGKISGLYQAEDITGQTDLLLYLDNPAAPLTGLPRAYLGYLLTAQAETLERCAALAAALGQNLAHSEESSPAASPARPARTSYTLEEARRGLSEAEAALRKAAAAIGGLEEGFMTILSKGSPAAAQAAGAAVAIQPELFEKTARDFLDEIGTTNAGLVPALRAAAEKLRQALAAPDGLTTAGYRQSYTIAVRAAHEARQALLPLVARLRQQIAAQTLPLVLWRVHGEVEEIAESLRWGVLRG